MPAFSDSICHGCKHLREVRTERSVFLRCLHPDTPKYPPQPVRACGVREPKT